MFVSQFLLSWIWLILRATKAGQRACPRQAKHGSLVSRSSISLAERLFGDRRCHSDASWPSFSPVFVLSSEIGWKKGRLFPRPPKHHQCSTTSCCIFSDMFAWAQTRVFPFEQGMRALKIVRLPDWVWSGCECPVSFSGRNSDYGAAVISIEGFSCWQPELIDWLIDCFNLWVGGGIDVLLSFKVCRYLWKVLVIFWKKGFKNASGVIALLA